MDFNKFIFIRLTRQALNDTIHLTLLSLKHIRLSALHVCTLDDDNNKNDTVIKREQIGNDENIIKIFLFVCFIQKENKIEM